MHKPTTFLDCTLRDGGYYNNWDFEPDLVKDYLQAMAALKVDYVEIGLRSIINTGFNGGFAYSTDAFLNGLAIPDELAGKIGVMVNASELVQSPEQQQEILQMLFATKPQSPVSLVRIACHVHEFAAALPVATWLKDQGYKVGFNLMQIADRSDEEIIALAQCASEYPIDALYFADSMGSLNPAQVKHIVGLIRQAWPGEIGIHTHDNMNQALANSLAAVEAGVTWVDSTVAGMGRGPGNVQTEYLALALAPYRQQQGNITKLLELVRKYFKPMQESYRWGTNPYYYLAGKHGIHPSYIQEMLSDSRYCEEDILAVINHLIIEGGKKFNLNTLGSARHFYTGEAKGIWNPANLLENSEVLLLGTGPGVSLHRKAIESFIRKHKPIVIALNTQTAISAELIKLRIACHPVRLLADFEEHSKLPQPLITPLSMLPDDVRQELSDKQILDFGMQVEPGRFAFGPDHCITPTSLVMAYAFAVLASGKTRRAYLAGFDGYPGEDPRNEEMNDVVKLFRQSGGATELIAFTPTRYELTKQSIYGIIQ